MLEYDSNAPQCKRQNWSVKTFFDIFLDMERAFHLQSILYGTIFKVPKTFLLYVNTKPFRTALI